MHYSDLATRLESIDSKLTRNTADLSKNDSLISRLETQLNNARDKRRKLLATRLDLNDQRDTARRELNARLG